MAKAFVSDPMNDGYRTTPSSRATVSTPGTRRISAMVSRDCDPLLGFTRTSQALVAWRIWA